MHACCMQGCGECECECGLAGGNVNRYQWQQQLMIVSVNMHAYADAEGQRLSSKGEKIKQKVRSLGFEPRLSRPQREVLTTIRRPSESDGN